jgi:hypothetical protein
MAVCGLVLTETGKVFGPAFHDATALGYAGLTDMNRIGCRHRRHGGAENAIASRPGGRHLAPLLAALDAPPATRPRAALDAHSTGPDRP